jgi:hypothetical protein
MDQEEFLIVHFLPSEGSFFTRIFEPTEKFAPG